MEFDEETVCKKKLEEQKKSPQLRPRPAPKEKVVAGKSRLFALFHISLMNDWEDFCL